MYRLLAIDIDGTLVNSRNELTPVTREALIRAGEAGIRVVLATGRRYSHALPLVEPLGIDVPLVTASGALVKDPVGHKTLFRAEFEPGVLEQIVQIVDGEGYDPVLCADTFLDGFDFYVARRDVRSAELDYYMTKNLMRWQLWPEMIQSPPPGVFGGFCVGTLTQMSALDAILQREMPNMLHSHVLHPPHYRGFFIEISPAGITKWSAIQQLAKQWGIEDSEICAVGDDVNDLQMIRAAGLGVAMGNAQPAVKEAADRIAPTHDEDGLAEVVGWLLRGIY